MSRHHSLLFELLAHRTRWTDDYLTKPLRKPDLLAIINKIVLQRRAGKSSLPFSPDCYESLRNGLVQVSLQTQIRINLARTIFATTEEIPFSHAGAHFPPPRRFIILLSSCLYPHFLLPSKADRCIPKVPFSFSFRASLGSLLAFILSIGTYPLVRNNANYAVHQSQSLIRGLVSRICLRRICRRMNTIELASTVIPPYSSVPLCCPRC